MRGNKLSEHLMEAQSSCSVLWLTYTAGVESAGNAAEGEDRERVDE